MTYKLVSYFAGAGGDMQGATAVPGVEGCFAANHWDVAMASLTSNFPWVEPYIGDIHDADLRRFPAADIFWASPECPKWSQARGKRRDFDKQPDLFGETLPDEAADRSRALMWDIPKYLAAMKLRGRPVLAGVVENVIDVRGWIMWREWLTSIINLGYRVRVIALNSMHARPSRTQLAPQSRCRLYVAYWSESLGRDPDWDRWLRPPAWCPACEEVVQAVQWWKKPGADMGRYRAQYLYRCPRVSCRNHIVEPAALPAAAAIDWSLRGTRIGDRPVPLKPKTIARIEAGLRKYARPISLEAAGNTFERRPGVRTWPLDAPLTTQTATATKGIAWEALMVPAGGTWRRDASPASEPMPCRTTRENDGLAVPPFLAPLRSGRLRTIAAGQDPLATIVADGSNHALLEVEPFLAVLRGQSTHQPVSGPIGTVTGMGAHHALIMRNNTARGDSGHLSTPVSEPLRTLTTEGHQSLIAWEQAAGHMLVPYYGTGSPLPAGDPVGTMTTRDRWSLASLELDVNDVLFRMLEPHEIGAAMAFAPGYKISGTSKRAKVRQYGNAVTPPVAEIIVGALVEAVSGEERAA